LENTPHKEIIRQLEADYYSISEQIRNLLDQGSKSTIHTCNGRFIQIRTKDCKPYTPIYSRTYNRYISNKNYAFYFKKEFMKYIQELSPDYPVIY